MSQSQIFTNSACDLVLDQGSDELKASNRPGDSEIAQGKKMRMDNGEMPGAISEKIRFFDVLEQLKFTNTPSLKIRKDIASKAAAEIHTDFGTIIRQAYENQYKAIREQMTEGRCTIDKISMLEGKMLEGKMICKVGDVFHLRLKSLSVSNY